MTKNILLLISCTIFCLASLAGNAFAGSDLNLVLAPATVQIGTFYNGATVQVTGQIPATADAVVQVRGSGEKLHLKKKGKVGGILWMNTGDVTFENAPSVDMIYVPKRIDDLEASPFSSLSLNALKGMVEVLPATEDKDFLFGEFLKMKQRDGLYIIHQESLSYGATENGVKTFTVDMVIPTRMKPGSYVVEVAVAQDGQLLSSDTKELKIEMISFPAEVSKLAFGRPILYGVLAVVIAIAAGLFTGIVFKGKGGAH